MKLEFRLLPLLAIRKAVNEGRFTVNGAIVLARNKIGRLSNGLRHSRADDPNIRHVNVTKSPGHVNRLSLSDVSSTFSNNEKDSGVKEYEDWYNATNNTVIVEYTVNCQRIVLFKVVGPFHHLLTHKQSIKSMGQPLLAFCTTFLQNL